MTEGVIAIRKLKGILVSLIYLISESQTNREIELRRSRVVINPYTRYTPVYFIL